MCLNPLTIKSYKDIHGKGTGYILVPCGVCPQCLSNKQNYIIQRVRLVSRNHYVYMCTLTYDDIHLPYFEYRGQKFTYVNIKHFQDLMHNLRRHCSYDLKYLFVTERGKKRHRPHLHVLFFVRYSNFDNIDMLNIGSDLQELILKYWACNIGTRKFPIYEPLFQLKYTNGRSNFDFHPVVNFNGDKSDAYFYTTKYVLKYDTFTDNIRKYFYATMTPEEYKKYWNLWKPRCIFSKNFGADEINRGIIREMIDFSKNIKHPCFVNPDGSTFPLSPYLFNKFGTLADKEFFSNFTPDLVDEHNNNMRYENLLSKHSRTLKFLSDKY